MNSLPTDRSSSLSIVSICWNAVGNSKVCKRYLVVSRGLKVGVWKIFSIQNVTSGCFMVYVQQRRTSQQINMIIRPNPILFQFFNASIKVHLNVLYFQFWFSDSAFTTCILFASPLWLFSVKSGDLAFPRFIVFKMFVTQYMES